MVGIYKITNPAGQIYIGQSVQIEIRKQTYSLGKCKKQPKIHASIIEHGWNNHTFEVIHECGKLELDDLEVYYIQLYQSFNTEQGLNLSSGGKMNEHTEETKKKISEANKGRKLSELTKQRLSDAWKTRVVTEETKAKMSIAFTGEKNSFYGKTHSAETRAKISAVHKGKQVGEKNPFFGKKHSEETIKRLSEVARKRKVHPSKGKVRSEESKVKQRIAMSGRKQSLEQVNKTKNTKAFKELYGFVCVPNTGNLFIPLY